MLVSMQVCSSSYPPKDLLIELQPDGLTPPQVSFQRCQSLRIQGQGRLHLWLSWIILSCLCHMIVYVGTFCWTSSCTGSTVGQRSASRRKQCLVKVACKAITRHGHVHGNQYKQAGTMVGTYGSNQSRDVYFNSETSFLHWKSNLRNVWGQ
jgi:hypothetical protein